MSTVFFFAMGFFSEAKGGGLPSISSTIRRSSSGSRSEASLKLTLLLVLVAAACFWVGRKTATTSSSSSSSSSTSSLQPPPPVAAIPHGKSGSPEEFSINIVTLSLKPRVFFLPGFADPALASALADATEPKLSPSTLALRAGEKAEDKVGIRTSEGTFVTAAEDPTGFLAAVERKAEALTGIPKAHGEAFNVLRYRPGGRYETHYDYFDDEEYGPQASQRAATLLVYLKVPPRNGGGIGDGGGGGGETCFPLAELEGEELARGVRDFRACSGLKVPPTRPGDAVLFYNLHPNGTTDKRSMHGEKKGGWEQEKEQEESVLLLFLIFSLSPNYPTRNTKNAQ